MTDDDFDDEVSGCEVLPKIEDKRLRKAQARRLKGAPVFQSFQSRTFYNLYYVATPLI